ncbi:hypothetical protein L2E82_32625 [Cichorium intybus]|uniref:Uncharacterized protein n=1 Tax=Cichorium intybus TaxID=13427 RepID=A0ACB9BGX8_CICIN|nr:hypothetical protein L2E82_32625 [Cichorium intybus]
MHNSFDHSDPSRSRSMLVAASMDIQRMYSELEVTVIDVAIDVQLAWDEKDRLPPPQGLRSGAIFSLGLFVMLCSSFRWSNQDLHRLHLLILLLHLRFPFIYNKDLILCNRQLIKGN